MSPARDANPAVTRFRQVMTVSMLVKIGVLFAALLLLGAYLGGT